MERSMLHIIFSVLLLTPAVLSEISIDLNYDSELKDVLGKRYDIRGTIQLNCKVSASDSEAFNVKWEKEGGVDVKSIDPLRYSDNIRGNSYGFKLSNAHEDDMGTYTCIVSTKDNQELKRANITLSNRVRVKTSGSLNFIEGENLRIPCQVLGKPTPTISWKIGNETYEESSGRVELLTDTEKKVDNAILFIKEAQMSDRGTYECIATPEVGNEMSSITMVRIKDKYAALWPFLGICAEVFVLCAIILIYEKKRNKTELEESDTDQSPDQKNTPDHGKDTNLRHRQ